MATKSASSSARWFPTLMLSTSILKAINSGTLGFRRLEKDDEIEITGVGVGEPFGPGGLPLIKIRARKGQEYLEMEIL